MRSHNGSAHEGSILPVYSGKRSAANDESGEEGKGGREGGWVGLEEWWGKGEREGGERVSLCVIDRRRDCGEPRGGGELRIYYRDRKGTKAKREGETARDAGAHTC